MFFVIDDKVYDKNGYVVDFLTYNHEQITDQFTKKPWSEVLILPKGTDCTKFSILFISDRKADGFGCTSCRKSLFYAEYDINGTDKWNGPAEGGLTVFNEQTFYGYSTVLDISIRDNIFPQNYLDNVHISSTDLIGNSYYVFISTNHELFRYKLNASGFNYDNYTWQFNSAENGDIRSESELIRLSNGDYRIAIPHDDLGKSKIKVAEIDDATMQIIPATVQTISVGAQNSISGLEFDATGDYLYYTKMSSVASDVLHIYDIGNQSPVNTSTFGLTNVSDFQYSYIERYGDSLYLANDSYLALIANPSAAGTTGLIGWDDDYRAITYNAAYYQPYSTPTPQYRRYILPDQIDDGNYSAIKDATCDCCTVWNNYNEESYTAQSSST